MTSIMYLPLGECFQIHKALWQPSLGSASTLTVIMFGGCGISVDHMTHLTPYLKTSLTFSTPLMFTSTPFLDIYFKELIGLVCKDGCFVLYKFYKLVFSNL